MLGMIGTRSQGFVDTPRWYVLRWGKKFKLACITAEGAYKLQERGWQLGERVCDSKEEAEAHRNDLQHRARIFQERQRMLVWEVASALKAIDLTSHKTDDVDCSRSASISRQFDAAVSLSIFNGFQLN